MRQSCSFCREPGGTDSLYPVYGLGPHDHFGASVFGSTRYTGRRPKGFTPDNPGDPMSLGTWWCKRCGAGKPRRDAARMIQRGRAASAMRRYRRRKARG